jgi:hypothetical protein
MTLMWTAASLIAASRLIGEEVFLQQQFRAASERVTEL